MFRARLGVVFMVLYAGLLLPAQESPKKAAVTSLISTADIATKNKAFAYLKTAKLSKEEKELGYAATIIATQPDVIGERICSFLPDLRWLFINIVPYKTYLTASYPTKRGFYEIDYFKWHQDGKSITVAEVSMPGRVEDCSSTIDYTTPPSACAKLNKKATNSAIHPHGICKAITYGALLTDGTPKGVKLSAMPGDKEITTLPHHEVRDNYVSYGDATFNPEHSLYYAAWNSQGTALASSDSMGQLIMWVPGVTKKAFKQRMVKGARQYAATVSNQPIVQGSSIPHNSCVIS